MPEDTDRCAQSILDDNPDMDESTAHAICNDMKNRGVLEAFNEAEPNAALHALAQFRNPGDIQRVEKDGGILYKRVMLLAPGAWTDAGSRSTAVWEGDAIRRSADNWVDENLNPVEEIPLNLLHGPRLHDDDTMAGIGTIPKDSIIVDEENRMFGDLFLHGDSPASELAIQSFDLALETDGRKGLDGPSVETVKERSAKDDELGVRRVQEIWYSGVGLVYNPAARSVDMRNQIRERAVAMAEDAGLDEAGVYVDAANQTEDTTQSLKARFRQRWYMADEEIDIENLSDDELRSALSAMYDDMNEIRAALQDDEALAVVLDAVQQYASAGEDLSAGADAFRDWAAANVEIDEAVLDDVLSTYLQEAGVEDLSETPVEQLQSWLAEMAGGGEEPEEEAPELSAEDLEAAKATIAEFNDHLADVKDMLTEYKSDVENTVEESIDDFERRLTELEEESVPRSLVEGKTSEFVRTDEKTGEYVPSDPPAL